MSGPIRVLQVEMGMIRAGIETMIMNYYRNIDRSKVQFDFAGYKTEKCDYDDEITSGCLRTAKNNKGENCH